jgi:small subunit ribosomal protein S20
MPITESAFKARRQNQRRKKRNLVYKKRIKTLEKQFERFLAQKQFDQARSLLPKIYQILDKAAKENVFKPNKSSRKKSTLTRVLNNKKL